MGENITMFKRIKLPIVLLIMSIILVFTGCEGKQDSKQDITGKTSIEQLPNDRPVNATIKEFNIVAQKTNWEMKGKQYEAFTYNGTVPGEEIRVKEGDWIKVNLTNNLDEPTTIHWHGMTLPNKMDGVAGVTQNAVLPGDTFTYEFLAAEAGTYWYHSHQQSFSQVDRGLYGALIIEEHDKSSDREYTLFLDEWALGESSSGGMMMGHGGTPGEMDSQMLYDTFTVNGLSYPNITPLNVKLGEKVRLRIINAGYQKHVLNLNNHHYRLIANDGKSVINSPLISDVLVIAPGERIDIEFIENGTQDWLIDSPNNVDEASDIKIPVNIIDVASNETVNKNKGNQLKLIDYTNMGEMAAIIEQVDTPDLSYEMKLSAGMSMMKRGMVYKINDEIFPDTPPLKVNEGDIVKVTITNNSMLDHPMHLHGHYFQVLSRNGKTLKSPLVKDTLNIKPHETFEIIFIADNPGHWLFHCHDLVHATSGMVTVLKYNQIYTPYTIGGEHENQPE
jgi:FtsP/CotA-like multicopper oxidase with cupredoxin domain